MFRSGCDQEIRRAVCGARGMRYLAEWIFAHAPHEHRSLLAEIDVSLGKGLASPAVLVLLFLRMTLQAKLDQPVH